VCSGKDAGVMIPGALVARGEFAKQNPEAVAKFLAVYLRAVSFEKSNKAEAMGYLRKLFDANGIKLNDGYLEQELARPIFTLEEQLKLMARTGGKSSLDQAYESLSAYLKGVGTLTEVPDPATYITDDYMKRVDQAPALKAFANNAN
jgi:NitT/TauT family transport system substrate-binding protein